MKKYKKMTQFLVSKKLRRVVFFYLLRNHGAFGLLGHLIGFHCLAMSEYAYRMFFKKTQ